MSGLLMLFLVGLGIAMIIGQRRGANAYLRWTGRGLRATIRYLLNWLWNLVVWFLGIIGYGMENLAHNYPVFVGWVVIVLVSIAYAYITNIR